MGRVLFFLRLNLDGSAASELKGSSRSKYAYIAKVEVYKCAHSEQAVSGSEILRINDVYERIKWMDARDIGRPIVTCRHWNRTRGHKLVVINPYA